VIAGCDGCGSSVCVGMSKKAATWTTVNDFKNVAFNVFPDKNIDRIPYCFVSCGSRLHSCFRLGLVKGGRRALNAIKLMWS